MFHATSAVQTSLTVNPKRLKLRNLVGCVGHTRYEYEKLRTVRSTVAPTRTDYPHDDDTGEYRQPLRIIDCLLAMFADQSQRRPQRKRASHRSKGSPAMTGTIVTLSQLYIVNLIAKGFVIRIAVKSSA